MMVDCTESKKFTGACLKIVRRDFDSAYKISEGLQAKVKRQQASSKLDNSSLLPNKEQTLFSRQKQGDFQHLSYSTGSVFWNRPVEVLIEPTSKTTLSARKKQQSPSRGSSALHSRDKVEFIEFPSDEIGIPLPIRPGNEEHLQELTRFDSHIQGGNPYSLENGIYSSLYGLFSRQRCVYSLQIYRILLTMQSCILLDQKKSLEYKHYIYKPKKARDESVSSSTYKSADERSPGGTGKLSNPTREKNGMTFDDSKREGEGEEDYEDEREIDFTQLSYTLKYEDTLPFLSMSKFHSLSPVESCDSSSTDADNVYHQTVSDLLKFEHACEHYNSMSCSSKVQYEEWLIKSLHQFATMYDIETNGITNMIAEKCKKDKEGNNPGTVPSAGKMDTSTSPREVNSASADSSTSSDSVEEKIMALEEEKRRIVEKKIDRLETTKQMLNRRLTIIRYSIDFYTQAVKKINPAILNDTFDQCVQHILVEHECELVEKVNGTNSGAKRESEGSSSGQKASVRSKGKGRKNSANRARVISAPTKRNRSNRRSTVRNGRSLPNARTVLSGKQNNTRKLSALKSKYAKEICDTLQMMKKTVGSSVLKRSHCSSMKSLRIEDIPGIEHIPSGIPLNMLRDLLCGSQYGGLNDTLANRSLLARLFVPSGISLRGNHHTIDFSKKLWRSLSFMERYTFLMNMELRISGSDALVPFLTYVCNWEKGYYTAVEVLSPKKCTFKLKMLASGIFKILSKDPEMAFLSNYNSIVLDIPQARDTTGTNPNFNFLTSQATKLSWYVLRKAILECVCEGWVYYSSSVFSRAMTFQAIKSVPAPKKTVKQRRQTSNHTQKGKNKNKQSTNTKTRNMSSSHAKVNGKSGRNSTSRVKYESDESGQSERGQRAETDNKISCDSKPTTAAKIGKVAITKKQHETRVPEFSVSSEEKTEECKKIEEQEIEKKEIIGESTKSLIGAFTSSICFDTVLNILLCNVCGKNTVSRMLLPCSHLCLCDACVVETCPICFKKPESSQKVNFSSIWIKNPPTSETPPSQEREKHLESTRCDQTSLMDGDLSSCFAREYNATDKLTRVLNSI